MRVRWETARRWYEVELVCDLLGDWVLIRRWGGKESGRHGKKLVVVASERDGLLRLERIHRVRARRNPPYWRIFNSEQKT
ncbi:hypothetical protein [Burkholderia cepacia]|uniref:hypothetical protein n=1 Tax=Burkholderia cepacia TaxID=292 RepID=UPI00158C693C|nr:hypothetical protein [Burkholderia cepacia]